VAGELRSIAGMLQIVTDLERIGDYAVDISKNAIKLADVAIRPATVETGRIASLAQAMLSDVLRAYREGDGDLCDAVIERDDEVDELYREGIAALQREMQRDPHVVPAGTLLLFVISIIERVGDRAQNIAWHTKDIYAK
jgi:phosphate transport system protein